MKRISMAVGACLVAGFCQVCVAQTEKKPVAKPPQVQVAPKPPPEITKDRLIQIEKDYSQVRSLLYTDPIDCPIASVECRVPIYLYQWSDASGPHCVGLLPKIVRVPGTLIGNNAKRIVWELQLPFATPLIPPDSWFEFLGNGDQGILLFKNIVPPAASSAGARGKQLKEGKVGPDPGNPMPRDKFHMKNEHRWLGQGTMAAAYLPIVVNKAPKPGLPDGVEVSLCGIPDPLIENVP